MSLSLYEFSIPVLLRGLTNLSSLLDKGAAHAAAKKFDSIVLVQARLYPDMYPLSRQVQIACDTAKGAAARLAGLEIPKHEDNEVTLADLKQRIAKTIDFVSTVSADKLKDAEGAVDRDQNSKPYLQVHGSRLPHRLRAAEFLFPRDVAYALLRHNGVESARPTSSVRCRVAAGGGVRSPRQL